MRPLSAVEGSGKDYLIKQYGTKYHSFHGMNFVRSVIGFSVNETKFDLLT